MQLPDTELYNIKINLDSGIQMINVSSFQEWEAHPEKREALVPLETEVSPDYKELKVAREKMDPLVFKDLLETLDHKESPDLL